MTPIHICLGNPNDPNSLTTLPTEEVLKKKSNECRIISLESLSISLEHYLDWKGKDPCLTQPNDNPVKIFESLDGHLLRCSKAKTSSSKQDNDDGEEVGEDEDDDEYEIGTILGIRDNQSLFSGRRSMSGSASSTDEKIVWKQETEMKIKFQLFQPMPPHKEKNNDRIGKGYDIRSNHPQRDWTRRPIKFNMTSMKGSMDDNSGVDGQVKVFDLSSLQNLRRQNIIDFSIDTPGYVCHLLRSILQLNADDNNTPAAAFDPHFVSPWSTNDHGIDTTTDHVFAILLRNQIERGYTPAVASTKGDDDSEWDALEKREIAEVMKFRTGDACPSFYLHSASQIGSNFDSESFVHLLDKSLNGNHDGKIASLNGTGEMTMDHNGYTLLTYRTLPPRDQFKDQIDDDNNNLELPLGCLREEYIQLGKVKDAANIQHRIVAPPYQSHRDIYGDLLKGIFTDSRNLKLLTNEVKRIPQWTAWPERNHYQSDYDEDDDDENGTYPASWTVFPLVYCFPACDVSARQWIQKTCAFVPHTTTLLQKLGPYLRTALFSRLDPRTTLGSHSGWADLANHVLRVHIPLVVPSGEGNDGLCGTWVDGCVETHKEGQIICFDDSKTHRAFNYSEEERIVLIIDLERPTDLDFPGGTASGGHTNELDAFIKQFS